MPTQPIVTISRKEDQSDKLARVIMAEKLSQGVMGFSEMLNKGISAYQDAKQKQQTKELSAIQAAATLVGGPDKLPTETKNKLPGILGIELPRDEKGNVVLTPSVQDVMNRSIEKAAESDPITFGKVKSGMQGAARDPQEVKLDQEKTAAELEGKKLSGKIELLKMQNENDQKALDRADKERQNIRDNETKLAAGGPGGARVRADNEKSSFWLDKQTGNQLSEAAVRTTLAPGEDINDRYWNPTHKELKEHNDAQRTQARLARVQSANDLDRIRKEKMDATVKALNAKDPDGVKFIMDGMRDAQALKKAGSPNADAAIEYWNNEWITKLGKEAAPEDYGWMIKLLPESWRTGFGLHEVKTGRGSEINVPGPSKSQAAVEGAGAMKAGGQKKAKSVDEWLAQ